MMMMLQTILALAMLSLASLAEAKHAGKELLEKAIIIGGGGRLFGADDAPQCGHMQSALTDIWLLTAACGLINHDATKFMLSFRVRDTLPNSGERLAQDVEVELTDLNGKPFSILVTYDLVAGTVTSRSGEAWWPGALEIAVAQMRRNGGNVEGVDLGILRPAEGYRGLEYLTGLKGDEKLVKGLSREDFIETCKKVSHTPLLVMTPEKGLKVLEHSLEFTVMKYYDDKNVELWNPYTSVSQNYTVDVLMAELLSFYYLKDFPDWGKSP